MQKLEQKESPWIAIEALYSSLNNWKRQYGADILDSVKYLKTSLTPIADLGSESEVLPPIFGENLPKVLDYAKKAESMKLTAEKKIEKDQLNIVDVVALKDDIQSFLDISKDVLSMLYAELISEEDSIDRLVPTKDYLWEKNPSLRGRLKKATETLSNPSNYMINQIMENLPVYLSYVDEAVQTLTAYNEQKEFLLNYPTAEAAIEEAIKTKETYFTARPSIPNKVCRRIPKTILYAKIQRIRLRQRQPAANQKIKRLTLIFFCELHDSVDLFLYFKFAYYPIRLSEE